MNLDSTSVRKALLLLTEFGHIFWGPPQDYTYQGMCTKELKDEQLALVKIVYSELDSWTVLGQCGMPYRRYTY